MTASLPPGQLGLTQLWPPTCRAGQPVITEPLAGSSLSSKPCSCHLGQAGSMWLVPAKSLSVLKVESWCLFPFLTVCSSETYDMLDFISLMIVQPAHTCELSIQNTYWWCTSRGRFIFLVIGVKNADLNPYCATNLHEH